MRLRYMFADKRRTVAHPFHVKSIWQPPIQNSIALERYLKETKLEIASIGFYSTLDIISANERKTIGSLKTYQTNQSISKKLIKEQLLSLLTPQKIEGLQQLSDDKFYKPLTNPNCARQKLNRIVNKLFRSGNIDTMTHKWLTIGLKHPGMHTRILHADKNT